MAAPFDRRNIDWVLACPLRPRSRRGAHELQAAIAALKAERAGILTLEAREPGAVWLGGWDERALEAHVTWILAHMTEALDVGGPEAGYREVIGRSAVVDHRRHDRTGGPRQLMLAVEPRGFPKGQSYETHIAVSGFSDETRRTIEAGVVKGLDSGAVADCPMIAVLVTVLALDLGHPAASGLVLEEALRVALRDALWQAEPRLVEPIMALQVTTPESFIGQVCGDLASRRSQLSDTDRRGGSVTISAEVPIANLYGYANSLRSLTEGRATYVQRFSHYAQVPGSPPPDDDPPPEAAAGALKW